MVGMWQGDGDKDGGKRADAEATQDGERDPMIPADDAQKQSLHGSQGQMHVYQRQWDEFRGSDWQKRRTILKTHVISMMTTDVRNVTILDYEKELLGGDKPMIREGGVRVMIEPDGLVQKYVCWRKNLLFFGFLASFFGAVCQLISIIHHREEHAGDDAVAMQNATLQAEIRNLTADILSPKTQQHINHFQLVFKYMTLGQLFLAAAGLGMAWMRWRNYNASVNYARAGWSLHFFLPFICVYYPWLTYMDPTDIINDSCTWAVGMVQDTVHNQFNTTVDLLATDPCSGDPRDFGANMQEPAEMLVNVTAVRACVYIIDGLKLVMQHSPSLHLHPELLANVTGILENTTSFDSCASNVTPIVEPYIDRVFEMVSLFLRAAQLVPNVVVLLVSVMHLFPTVLGLTFGMLRGLKVVKLMLPADRLSTWLLTTLTIVSLPLSAMLFACVVAFLGTWFATLASLCLLLSRCVYATGLPGYGCTVAHVVQSQIMQAAGDQYHVASSCGPSYLLTARSYKTAKTKLTALGYAGLVLIVLGGLFALLAVLTTPRLADIKDFGITTVQEKTISMIFHQVAGIIKAFGFGMATTVVFADFSLGIVNSVHNDTHSIRDHTGVHSATHDEMIKVLQDVAALKTTGGSDLAPEDVVVDEEEERVVVVD